jgi:hypothetical protein
MRRNKRSRQVIENKASGMKHFRREAVMLLIIKEVHKGYISPAFAIVSDKMSSPLWVTQRGSGY